MRAESIQKTLAAEWQKSIVQKAQPSADESFADEFQNMIADVNRYQEEANRAMGRAATGEADGIHETMIQLEEADISLRMLLKTRNKALDAYHEIMRMQF
jgi:flagellar hook-basal body complex protein FliE